MTAATTFFAHSQPPHGQPMFRYGLLLALVALFACGVSLLLLIPSGLREMYQYPNSMPTTHCSPLLPSPAVAAAMGRISYRVSECFLTNDSAEQVAKWYEALGWTQRVFIPIAQASHGDIIRLGPLTVVILRQATAVKLGLSPTHIKTELGIRLIWNK